MNYKTNQKYYTQKTTLTYVGIALAVIGMILFFIGFYWMIPAIISLSGIGIVAMSRESLVRGSELDACVASAAEEFGREVLSSHGLTEDMADVTTLYGYDYDGMTAATMGKGTDGVYRPKTATATCIAVAGQRILIAAKTFSLVEDSSRVSETTLDMASLSAISVTDKAINDEGGVLLRYHALTVFSSDGSTVAEYPAGQSSVLYDKSELLTRKIKNAAKAAQS